MSAIVQQTQVREGRFAAAGRPKANAAARDGPQWDADAATGGPVAIPSLCWGLNLPAERHAVHTQPQSVEGDRQEVRHNHADAEPENSVTQVVLHQYDATDRDRFSEAREPSAGSGRYR
jgi:hypothetical protein